MPEAPGPLMSSDAQARTVTLPSGRRLDLHRSRWDGVLDAEEYEYCLSHAIALGFDCVQVGWVTQTCTDESMPAVSRAQLQSHDPTADDDAELRTRLLREQVLDAAREVLAHVGAGGLAPDDARLKLTLIAAGTAKTVASEMDLADLDLCHWALQCAAIGALGEVRGPLHQAPRPSGRSPITFRPWTVDDVDVYTDLLGNPNVWEHLPEPYPETFDSDTARTLIEVGAIGFHHETMAVEVDGTPIGQCLLRFDRAFAGTRAAEVGYWLGEQHWGKGRMSAILPAFTHRSFEHHPIDVIYAWIRTDNEASVRAAEGAGYQRAPFPREAEVAASMRRPGFVRYATFRAEWNVGEADRTAVTSAGRS